MLQPKIVCFDTARWGNLTRDYQADAKARSIVDFLNCGDVIPFITWHHLAELADHSVDAVYCARWDLIRKLRFIAFCKTPEPTGNIGTVMDVREAEIRCVLSNPNLSLEQTISHIASSIRSGFCSGDDLHDQNREGWDFYRPLFSRWRQSRSAAIASVTHAPLTNPKEKWANASYGYRFRSADNTRKQMQKMTEQLADSLSHYPDKRMGNPKKLAESFMQEVCLDGINLNQLEGDPLERLLKLHGVDRKKLPKNPTNEDVGYEAIFRAILRVHAEAMLVSEQTLSTVDQGKIPSWIIWREIDRGMKRQQKPRGSDQTDKFISCFGLYVDALDMDKRVQTLIRQGARNNGLLRVVERRLVKSRSYSDLLIELREFAKAKN